MDKWREHSSKALTSSSDPHGAEASWPYWLQSILGISSSETSPGSFTAKEKNGTLQRCTLLIHLTCIQNTKYNLCSNINKFMSTEMHWSCKPLVWLTVFSFKLNLKLQSAFLKCWVIQTHVQRQRQQANLEQGQDRCDVLAFRQYCLSNANKVLDIFHTSQGHLFPRLLITVISSRFPFLSHRIECHFYTTCLYFPWSSPDTTVV